MEKIISIVASNDNLLVLCVSLITVLAITIIFKTQTTTNFSQTTISTFGAYFVAKNMYENGMSIWLAYGLGLILCLLIGLFIDIFIIRRGKNVNAVGKQIITMGFTYVLLAIISMAMQIHNPEGALVQLNPATVFFDTIKYKVVVFDNLTYTWNTLFCVGLTIIILTVLFLVIYKTKWGLGVRMTASNETVAQMNGVNTHVITASSWAISAVLGITAAVFINNAQGKLSTSLMSSIQISAFLGCVVGGFTTFWGPVVAALIIWAFGSVVNVISSSPQMGNIGTWKDVIVYAIAMIFVLIKPNGLFGKALRKKV